MRGPALGRKSYYGSAAEGSARLATTMFSIFAVVPASDQPIRISLRPTVISAPRREVKFPGLKAIYFAADDRTAVAATRKQAVYWYDDDRLETVPVFPIFPSL